MDKCSTKKILGLALAGIGALAATTVMAASPVKISGEFQADAVKFSGDSAKNDDNSWSNAFYSGTNLRRAQIALSGNIDDNWGYQVGLKRVSGSGPMIAIDQSWISYSGLKPVTIYIGKIGPSFGAESNGSSSATLFMERGAVDALVPADGFGVQVTGNTDMMSYQLSVSGPDDSVGMNQRDNTRSDPMTYAARVTFAPVATDTNVYHFGLDYAYSKVNKITDESQSSLGYGPGVSTRYDGSSTTRTLIVLPITNNGFNAVASTSTIGLEAAGLWGPVYAHGEYAKATLAGRDQAKDLDVKAYFVQAGYMLTGESRSYDKTSGTFGGVKPASNMGAWEIGLRYDVFDASEKAKNKSENIGEDGVNWDTDYSDLTAGKLKSWTVGVNWYASENVKFALNYVRSSADYAHWVKETHTTLKDRVVDAFAARAQLTF